MFHWFIFVERHWCIIESIKIVRCAFPYHGCALWKEKWTICTGAIGIHCCWFVAWSNKTRYVAQTIICAFRMAKLEFERSAQCTIITQGIQIAIGQKQHIVFAIYRFHCESYHRRILFWCQFTIWKATKCKWPSVCCKFEASEQG